MGNKTSNIKKGKIPYLGKDVLQIIALKCAKMDENMIFPLYITCKLFHDNRELKKMYKDMKLNNLIDNLKHGKYKKLKITFLDLEKKHRKAVCFYNLYSHHSYSPFFHIGNINPLISFPGKIPVHYGQMAFGASRIYVKYFMDTMYLDNFNSWAKPTSGSEASASS